ncbi:hypothetical protein DENSPDRAFT_850970 [Dentipellis sp. KUC8613]|nr:hypothetical protein DENSPDRAFT_850970 [Dentipellis sp. KUC8613]
MIMVQKPIHLLSSPTAHRRHPSAPPAVLVQSTRTPGLLSLSKPQHPTAQRPQQYQPQQRSSRSAQKGKVGGNDHRSPQPVPAKAQPAPASRKPSGPKDGLATSPKAQAASATADKAPRGRQHVMPTTKDKAAPRSTSHSSVRANRRQPHQHHQGSPPPPSYIPSQAEVSTSSKSKSSRSQSLNPRHPKASANPFDPFLVNSGSDNEASSPEASDATPNKSAAKKQTENTPKLASRPSGKLARRRQTLPEVPGTPTPPSSKAVPVPRGKQSRAAVKPLSRSQPVQSSMPARPTLLNFRSEETSPKPTGFPICDDLTDAEDDDVDLPSTPIREKLKTWQQSLVFDDGPRTAPLSSTFSGYPLYPSPTSTPSPDRKRRHQRYPSESVFNMSMDEDSSSSSSSDASIELKALVGLLPQRQRVPSLVSTPPPSNRSAKKEGQPGFFASSNFQNSPSPDELPPPAFGLSF